MVWVGPHSSCTLRGEGDALRENLWLLNPRRGGGRSSSKHPDLLCPPHSWSRQRPCMHNERQSVPYHDPSTRVGEGSQEAELALGGTFAGVTSCPIPSGVLHRVAQIRPRITAAPPTTVAGTSQPLTTVPGEAWWPVPCPDP